MYNTMVLYVVFLFLTTALAAQSEEKNILAGPSDTKVFKELNARDGEIVFYDDCTGDWKESWSLDGKLGKVENSPDGMNFYAGPEIRNDAHHAVLWTRQNFSGNLKIEYDYTRIDQREAQVTIIYIEATGSGEGAYAKDIFDWNSLRKVPAMKMYFMHMNTLHISYAALTGDGDYIRARRYRPDLGAGLKGTDLGAEFNTGFFETGLIHHITIIKKDDDLYMKVSNEEQSALYKWNYRDHPEILEGRIGLRHMYSRSARYKNFTVKTIE